MELDGYAVAESRNGTLKAESEDLTVWAGYLEHAKDGHRA